jgi:hypothetical protein
MILGNVNVDRELERWQTMNDKRASVGLPPIPMPTREGAEQLLNARNESGDGGQIRFDTASGELKAEGAFADTDLNKIFQPITARMSDEMRAIVEGRAPALESAGSFPWIWVGVGAAALGVGYLALRKR